MIVGVVGAAGLGRLFQNHLIARDYAAVGALALLTFVVDVLSTTLRRAWGVISAFVGGCGIG